MLPVERVAAAFAGEPTDRVPIHHIGFSSRAASVILEREAYVGGGIQWFREASALWAGPEAHAEFVERSFTDAVELARATDQDLIRSQYWRRYHEKPSRRIDERTFFYGDPEGAYWVRRFDPETELYQTIDQAPERERTLDDLERQVERGEKTINDYVPREALFADALRARTYFQHERAVRCGGVNLSIPYDPPIWLEATMERPGLVARYLDLQATLSCRNAARAGELGLPYLFGGGDFATNQGPMYSPRTFHDLMAPRLARISAACRAHGAKHLFGTDGNVWPVADDLFGASGVSGYYEVDVRAGMDLRRLRERFPHLTLVGVISSQTLHLGTKEEVVKETLTALETAQELRGILVGCSNQVVAQTPPENLLAMIETIRTNR